MHKLVSVTAAFIVAAAAAAPPVSAAPAKAAPKAKMVSVYQADKCHMYYSAAQAKKYAYACPDSHGKMKLVKVPAATAAKGLAATNAALGPKM